MVFNNGCRKIIPRRRKNGEERPEDPSNLVKSDEQSTPGNTNENKDYMTSVENNHDKVNGSGNKSDETSQLATQNDQDGKKLLKNNINTF